MIPALDLWDCLLPSRHQPVFHEDNQAMIRVIESGRNPTMRHLGRVHRISVAWLHEQLGTSESRGPVKIHWTETECMAADIYAKAFTDKDKWDHALRLIGIVDPKYSSMN